MATIFNSRAAAVTLVLAGISALIAFDLAISKPLNPYSAPALFAYGSNEAAGGAFCAIVPPAPKAGN